MIKNNYQELFKKSGVHFKNQALLDTAFTHRSYLNENPSAGEHNERLEFLGDAVLELAVTDYLFNLYPDKKEGELTSLRAALVRKSTLTEIAEELNFIKYLRLSKGEKKNQNKAKASILGNTTEAFIGALFLDQGFEKAREFINKWLLPRLKKILESKQYIDAKSHFQEIMQEKLSATPAYKVIREEGPDHDKTFTVTVYVNNKAWGSGSGPSKQEAEMLAAEEALRKVKEEG